MDGRWNGCAVDEEDGVVFVGFASA